MGLDETNEGVIRMKPKVPEFEPCPYCGMELEYPCTSEEDAYECYYNDDQEEDLEDDY